jgi:serine/threonine protein kinase
MAAVFLARDLVLERQVAIKVLPPDTIGDGQLIARFQQEAKTAAKLDHPNIIPIHRVETEAGLVYIVMKYVSGQSMEELLARGPLSILQIRHILREAAMALAHAHRRHIVHRDVKPANIMLDEDGRVVLTDFGISKAVQGSTELTTTGTIIGTPHYMSPEQIKGREVDGRADQYALAVVGHRALTGKLPFDGDQHSILYQQVFEPPPSVLTQRPDTPGDLRKALERAMAKDSRERFSTMEEFAASVTGERAHSIHSESTTIRVPTKAPQRTGSTVDHGAGVFVALGTVAMVVGVALFGLPKLQTAAGGSSTVLQSPSLATPEARRSTPARAVRPQASKSRGTGKLRITVAAPLSVRSNPKGVLYVNGVRVGLTPVINHRLMPGTHRLRIEQKGYRPISETIVIRGARPITRRYDLRRQAAR